MQRYYELFLEVKTACQRAVIFVFCYHSLVIYYFYNLLGLVICRHLSFFFGLEVSALLCGNDDGLEYVTRRSGKFGHR
jgi:hypothetical protein